MDKKSILKIVGNEAVIRYSVSYSLAPTSLVSLNALYGHYERSGTKLWLAPKGVVESTKTLDEWLDNNIAEVFAAVLESRKRKTIVGHREKMRDSSTGNINSFCWLEIDDHQLFCGPTDDFLTFCDKAGIVVE